MAPDTSSQVGTWAPYIPLNTMQRERFESNVEWSWVWGFWGSIMVQVIGPMLRQGRRRYPLSSYPETTPALYEIMQDRCSPQNECQ
jgi:hypothetical protein